MVRFPVHPSSKQPLCLYKREKSNGSEQKKKIEIFTAGCSTCQETVRRIAGANHDIEVHDMHQPHIATRAKHHGIRSLPSVVVDGELAGCCAERGPDETVLREAIR
jgi:glutaredoxin 3